MELPIHVNLIDDEVEGIQGDQGADPPVLHLPEEVELTLEEIVAQPCPPIMAASDFGLPSSNTEDLGTVNDVIFRESRVHCFNSIEALENMAFLPGGKGRMRIPLCRMLPMPIIQDTLNIDVMKMEADFVMGYRDGDRVFYVSITNENGLSQSIDDSILASWSDHWRAQNDEFERFLESDSDFEELRGKLFYVWDGNHRLKAWTQYIQRHYSHKRDWHFSVWSIVLQTGSDIALTITAMNDVNGQTKNSHVKQNLVHMLTKLQTVGVIPLESFSYFLSKEEIEESKKRAYETWYSMSKDKFMEFIHCQELASACDEAHRKYIEAHPNSEDWNSQDLYAAIQSARLEKKLKLKSPFTKYLAIANPELGPDFLDQIRHHYAMKEKPEMTLDKLQAVSTSCVSSIQKVLWLKLWNKSDWEKKLSKFPLNPTDAVLLQWLHKATWWSQLAEQAILILADVSSLTPILEDAACHQSLQEYIEHYRPKVWESAFIDNFTGKDKGVLKSQQFKN